MNLPVDDYMLLSLVNTKLRDEYPSFKELCEEEDVDGGEICVRLKRLGYAYTPEYHAFKPV